MGARSAETTKASRNRNEACTRGPAFRADLAVRVDRGRDHFISPLEACSNVLMSPFSSTQSSKVSQNNFLRVQSILFQVFCRVLFQKQH